MVRLGRVEFCCSYVVDLDNPEMIEKAQAAVYDEVQAIVDDGAIESCIKIQKDETAQPEEIPEFLTEVDYA